MSAISPCCESASETPAHTTNAGTCNDDIMAIMIADNRAANDAEETGPVRSLERGLRLLMELVRSRAPMTAAEISRRLNLPRITVFRLLATLEASGCVERAGAGHCYRVGLAVLRLGFDHLVSLDLSELGGPLLKKLSDETGLPCHLAVRDGRSMIYVGRAVPHSLLRSNVAVGASLPAHTTALGRVLLGDLSLSQLCAAYPESELPLQTGAALLTVRELFDMIQRDCERGYVFREPGSGAESARIAVPVRNRMERIVAAVGITIGRSCPDVGEVEALTARARLTARSLSCLLGG